MKRFLLIVFTFLFLFGCDYKKSYYYQEEGTKKEQAIEAISDSAAYVRAFELFSISEKVFHEMDKKYGYDNKPTGFKLLNDKKEDITYSISFVGKSEKEENIKKRIDGLPDNINKDIVSDSPNVPKNKEKCPVDVITAKVVTEEYSSYRNIKLVYKNVSNKKIVGIRFKWFGTNTFGESADMGHGGGFTDETLRPKQTGSGKWDIYSRDLKKVTIALPTEVVFSDGTKWNALDRN